MPTGESDWDTRKKLNEGPMDPRTGNPTGTNDPHFVADMFSAEEVHGPSAGGAWGTPGTPAYEANQKAQQESAGLAQQGQGVVQQFGQRAGDADFYGTALAGDAREAQNRAAPTTDWSGANAAAARGLDARGATQGTLGALSQFAGQQGQYPSAAQATIQDASNRGAGQALALAKSGRGFGGNAAAAGQAQQTIASTTAGAANAGATISAAEDAAAKNRTLAALQATLGGGLSQQGQDLAAQGQAANQAQFDTGTALTSRGQNDALEAARYQASLGYGQQGLGYQQLGQQTNLGLLGVGTDRQQLGQNALNQQAQYELEQQQMRIDAAKANQQADLEKDAANVGIVGNVIGGIAALSDERVKDLERRESALADALETVGNAPGYSYRYKDPGQPGAKHGRMMGPMAQDLERGPLGDTIVKDTPSGKMVDTGRLGMVNSSAITELNRKIKALEAALGRAA